MHARSTGSVQNGRRAHLNMFGENTGTYIRELNTKFGDVFII